jgi:hypothetical protein
VADIPNLAGVATDDLVEQIGGGNFKASYINWSRTMHLLRTHAPGWLPEAVKAANGSLIHEAPKGGYLSIRFVHVDGSTTPEVPQAIMDPRNAAIDAAKITARDVTDTHRRGVCMAASLIFGLAYELWAKIPLESGYGDQGDPPAGKPGQPTDGAWDALLPDQVDFIKKAADWIKGLGTDYDAADEYIQSQAFESEEEIALWTLLDSNIRTGVKKAHDNKKKGDK